MISASTQKHCGCEYKALPNHPLISKKHCFTNNSDLPGQYNPSQVNN
ncbi:hypothetical protein EC40967_A0126 [Escherichia coli 4.0967]|uniref:Uncharacterized protein n=4 Tax=Enterobacteriaceae TaxID=543 RepID=A0A2R4NFG9_KLEPN|nr:hypothetical protein KPH11_236 [Klebsiella pneumoniae subsp. pneumoniae]APA22984.1 hypothetical protein [Salmonella enterica subsp. enterica serovar Typhimurium]AVX34897.1 hypothetical protein [Klebsiella pneumoniae]EII35330.1 hypothetical protein EC40967_A0126 [Escherichia coli 4.0967]WJR85848.1 hypothetical protein [Enterobacter hormaechei subsp. steigerwaltii]